MFHNLPKEVYFQQALAPATDLGAAIVPATYIDVTQFERFGFVVLMGTSNRTTATIQIVQATAAAGTGSKNVTGAVNTTTPTTGQWAVVDCSADQLDINNGFRYVAVQCAVAGGTAGAAAVLFYGVRPRNESVTPDANLAQVVIL